MIPRGPKPGKAAVQGAIEAQRPLSAPSQQMALAPELAPEPERGPGRPAGRRNRRTADLIGYLEAQDALPGIALAKVVKGGPEQLARDLGVDRQTAFARWLAVCEALMPYAHPRLAQIQLDATVNDASRLHLLAVLGEPGGLELEGEAEAFDGAAEDADRGAP
jgi:hypothetical protein